MTPPPMDYVEFSVSDIARTKAFYAAIFGWEFTDYGPEYTSFVDNGLGGGFRSDAPPRPGGPLMVFHVDDLEACFERTKKTGAPILKPIYSFSRRTPLRIQGSRRLRHRRMETGIA